MLGLHLIVLLKVLPLQSLPVCSHFVENRIHPPTVPNAGFCKILLLYSNHMLYHTSALCYSTSLARVTERRNVQLTCGFVEKKTD